MNHMIQLNNDFTAFVQSVQCAPPTLTHDLRRSRHWSIAASITFCSKSTQVCVKRFCRSQMSQICFVNALLHDTPEFYNLQVHFNEEYTIHLIPFSLVISHCYNITFSLFWISQRSVATLTRMWANAQPDGRPAEHRWRPLFNVAKFGWRPLLDAVQ